MILGLQNGSQTWLFGEGFRIHIGRRTSMISFCFANGSWEPTLSWQHRTTTIIWTSLKRHAAWIITFNLHDMIWGQTKAFERFSRPLTAVPRPSFSSSSSCCCWVSATRSASYFKRRWRMAKTRWRASPPRTKRLGKKGKSIGVYGNLRILIFLNVYREYRGISFEIFDDA